MTERFPDAPEGAYVCEEGWLIVGDEAWTEEEWAACVAWRPRAATGGRPRLYDDYEHYLRRERKRRAYNARKGRAA